jgi:hypothetical protein
MLDYLRLDAYFCGHDHSLQHNYNAEQTELHHFLCGSGSGSFGYPVRAIPNYTVWNQAIGGFANVTIAGDTMEVQFISDRGTMLHSSGKIPRRDRTALRTTTKQQQRISSTASAEIETSPIPSSSLLSSCDVSSSTVQPPRCDAASSDVVVGLGEQLKNKGDGDVWTFSDLDSYA